MNCSDRTTPRTVASGPRPASDNARIESSASSQSSPAAERRAREGRRKGGEAKPARVSGRNAPAAAKTNTAVAAAALSACMSPGIPGWGLPP